MFCHKCGHELPEDSRFCSSCGALIEVEPQKAEILGEPPQNGNQDVDFRFTSHTIAQTTKASGTKKIAIGAIIALVVVLVIVFGVRSGNGKDIETKIIDAAYRDATSAIANHYSKFWDSPHAFRNYDDVTITKTGNGQYTINGYFTAANWGQFDDLYTVKIEGTAKANFFLNKFSFDYNLLYQDPKPQEVPQEASNQEFERDTSMTEFDHENMLSIERVKEICESNLFAFAEQYKGKRICIYGNLRDLSNTWIENDRYVTIECEDDDFHWGFDAACYFDSDYEDPYITNISKGYYIAVVGTLDERHCSSSSIHLVNCAIYDYENEDYYNYYG